MPLPVAQLTVSKQLNASHAHTLTHANVYIYTASIQCQCWRPSLKYSVTMHASSLFNEKLCQLQNKCPTFHTAVQWQPLQRSPRSTVSAKHSSVHYMKLYEWQFLRLTFCAPVHQRNTASHVGLHRHIRRTFKMTKCSTLNLLLVPHIQLLILTMYTL